MTSSQRLASRHALLTGAGGGIGLAVTEAFLAEGARCTAVDLAPEPSAGLAALLARYPDRLAYAAADVTRVDAIGALVDAAAAHFGAVDVLFNNAAVFDMAPLLESDAAMYERLFDVNVKGMFFVMQAVLARLVAAGRRGSVVNLASQAGRRGEALVAHYCASKAAVISYCESLRIELRADGVKVVTISPGYIDTPLTRGNPYRMPFLMPVDDFANQVFDAIAGGVSYRVIPWQMGVVAKLMRLLPNALFDRLASGRGRKPRASGTQ